MKNILKKLTELLLSKRHLFLFSWLIIIGYSIFFLINFKDENIESELFGARGTDADIAGQSLEDDFKIKSGSSAAIVTSSNTETKELIEALKNKFNQIEKIFEINSEKKHNYKLIYIDFKSKFSFVEVQLLTEDIRNFVKKIQLKPEEKIYVSGSTAFYYDMKDAGKKDSAKGEIIALSLSFIILIFNFGALVSAIVPIVIGALTIIFSNTIAKFIGLGINPISQVMSSLVGLGLSIDYSLFIVSRFREELKKGNSYQESLKTALGNSGKAIVISALIMLLSTSVLLLPDVSSSRIVVKNLLIVIAISVINSIFFLPIFLIYTRNLLDKPKFLSKLLRNNDNYTAWRKFSSHIVRHPKTYFIISTAILLMFSIPVYNIKLWEPSQTLAPEESESMQGYKLLQNDDWGGELVPIEIVIKSPELVYSKDSISFIYDFTKFLEKNTEVSSVQSITSWSKNATKEDYHTLFSSFYSFGLLPQVEQLSYLVNVSTGNNKTLIKVFPKSLMDIEQTHRIIKYAKEFSLNQSKYKVHIGGMIARSRDFTNELYNYIPQMFFIIFTSIYLLLFFYMKSVILPIKAAIMNFLPILSSFGILIMIFQYGYLHELLNTPINNAVTAMVPITLFCVVFGLSMDYEVLILSRISETYEETKDVNEAVIQGLSKSGSVITGAALILLVVFIPGIFSTSPGIKEICIGIISAIFIDSTIVRLMLVPSFVVLMGKWNWWNPLRK